jgi:hypothetical protein
MVPDASAKRANGFFGVKGAMMQPHADGRPLPGVPRLFLQGTIDHASTAWIAQLAWLNTKHSRTARP